MRRVLIVFWIITSFIGIRAQRQQEIDFIKKKVDFDENCIYLFCRGTSSKTKLIAQHFNLGDSNITHVGVGYYERNHIVIFNVIDVNRVTALRKDSLDTFIGSPDVYYFSIWECNSDSNDLN